MNAHTWTIAYRRPRGRSLHRATNWSGTLNQARMMATAFHDANPGTHVYYTVTAQAEVAGYVPAEDCGNMLMDNGRRMPITETGRLSAALLARPSFCPEIYCRQDRLTCTEHAAWIGREHEEALAMNARIGASAPFRIEKRGDDYYVVGIPATREDGLALTRLARMTKAPRSAS